MSWSARRENWTPQAEDAREDGDIDYARVIHSASFRRLQGKTQILNLGDSDFYRTRLTHSLEVAQIAGGIVKQLAKSCPDHEATRHLPERAMMHAIGCTHDFGHPPFGHGGEIALNYCMRDHGGFEGNGQTLRILSRLERFSKNAGANLSRRSLLGVLKYPVPYSAARNPDIVPALLSGPSTIRIIDGKASKPPKCHMDSEQAVVDWIVDPLSPADRGLFRTIAPPQPGKHGRALHKSLDCSIMDVADDIAYGVHDLEDAIALGLVSREAFHAALQDRCPSFLDALKAKYPGESENNVFSRMVDGLFGDEGLRKRFISRLVHHFITALEYREEPFEEPLLRYRVRVRTAQRGFLDILKDFVVREVITSPAVQHLEFKGQGMVVAVFEAMQADPERLLPRDVLARFDAAEGSPRIICDYVAAMTDTALLKTYERLFSPRMGSVFDKL
ncbi:MAG: anti-phage deoxyguanosine triphosphatase [Sphingobium sp.]